MIVINTLLMPRGWGKTTTLVIRSSATNYPILCYSHATKKAILDKAHELKVSIPDPIVFHDILNQPNRYRGIQVKKLLVDDADVLLKRIISDMFCADIDSISMTLSDEF